MIMERGERKVTNFVPITWCVPTEYQTFAVTSNTYHAGVRPRHFIIFHFLCISTAHDLLDLFLSSRSVSFNRRSGRWVHRSPGRRNTRDAVRVVSRRIRAVSGRGAIHADRADTTIRTGATTRPAAWPNSTDGIPVWPGTVDGAVPHNTRDRRVDRTMTPRRSPS